MFDIFNIKTPQISAAAIIHQGQLCPSITAIEGNCIHYSIISDALK